MSICDELQSLIAEQDNTLFDEKICSMYEEANTFFQELVDRGIAYKRGYQLLPIESTICKNVNFNVEKT